MRVVLRRSLDTPLFYDHDRILEVKSMRKMRILIALASVGAFFALAGNALATPHHVDMMQASSLYRPFPEGINPNNANQALSQVMSRASWDSQYAQVIMQQTGDSSFDSSHYTTLGYSAHAPAGTTNSALTGSGTVVPVTDHDGSQSVKVLLVMNIVTKQTVAIMVRCGNPRLHPFTKPIPWKPFQKGTLIHVNRQVSKPVSIKCPSGQEVTGTVTATVRGVVSARTWGKVQGSLNLRLQQSVNLQVKVLASLKCGAAPVQPPAKGACSLNGVPQPSVPSGYVVDVAGNCVQQTNNAEQNCKASGGSWNGATQLCTIIQVNGNCSNIIVVNGSNNTVSSSQQGNCNSGSTPPSSNFMATVNASASATATATVNCPGGSATATATATATASGSGSGSATSTVSQQDAQNKAQAIADANAHASASANANASASVSASAKCTPAPPPPTVVTFTMSFDTINDIPAGTCRPEPLHVTSSVAGQVQVSPSKGLISAVDCYQPNTGQLSMVRLAVKTGSQDLTVYVYEPNDSSLTSDTLTAVPIIAGVVANSNTASTSFTVSHPIRPFSTDTVNSAQLENSL
jgi:hypothetical protein